VPRQAGDVTAETRNPPVAPDPPRPGQRAATDAEYAGWPMLATIETVPVSAGEAPAADQHAATADSPAAARPATSDDDLPEDETLAEGTETIEANPELLLEELGADVAEEQTASLGNRAALARAGGNPVVVAAEPGATGQEATKQTDAGRPGAPQDATLEADLEEPPTVAVNRDGAPAAPAPLSRSSEPVRSLPLRPPTAPPRPPPAIATPGHGLPVAPAAGVGPPAPSLTGAGAAPELELPTRTRWQRSRWLVIAASAGGLAAAVTAIALPTRRPERPAVQAADPRLQQTLATADERIAAGRLSGPDSALSHLLHARELDPHHDGVNQRLAALADRFEQLASNALAAGNPREAAAQLEAALAADEHRTGLATKLQRVREQARQPEKM
jgi:hypothetical protein